MAAPHVTFLRQNLTPAEQRLWQQLRARRSTPLRFRRQYPIGNYIVDFVCLAARLIVRSGIFRWAELSHAPAAPVNPGRER